ncbi:MAG: MerR family transcriptional regulator [Acidimicrobiales bacterium]
MSAGAANGRPAGADYPRYVISVAAELVGIHPQTLRAYERVGLLQPARTPGGGRRYSDLDLVRAARIAELTRLGLPHVGIKLVLDLEEQLRRIQAVTRTAVPDRSESAGPTSTARTRRTTTRISSSQINSRAIRSVQP